MKHATPLVITISRQLGCGGAYIGQQLSMELSIHYSDREIIRKAAEQLSISEKQLDLQDEKTQSFWDSFAFCNVYSADIYIPPPIQIMPTSYELFDIESEIIEHIAREHSSVIIGRCGFHVLRNHPNHVSIFLHGDMTFRNRRIQKLYNVSEKEAAAMIMKSDKEREQYVHTFTDCKWADATLYDLSIDTSKLDLDDCVKFIIDYLNFPD